MARTRTRTIDDWLRTATAEVSLALAPLPEGYFIEADDVSNSILIYSKFPEPEGMGFALTEGAIKMGRHIEVAIKHFPNLIRAVHEAGGPLHGPDTGRIQ